MNKYIALIFLIGSFPLESWSVTLCQCEHGLYLQGGKWHIAQGPGPNNLKYLGLNKTSAGGNCNVWGSGVLKQSTIEGAPLNNPNNVDDLNCQPYDHTSSLRSLLKGTAEGEIVAPDKIAHLVSNS